MRLRCRILSIPEQYDETPLPLFEKWKEESTMLYVFDTTTNGKGEIIYMRIGEVLPKKTRFDSEFWNACTYEFTVSGKCVELFPTYDETPIKDKEPDEVQAYFDKIFNIRG